MCSLHTFVKKDWKDVNAKINKAYQIILIISIPCGVGLAILAQPVWFEISNAIKWFIAVKTAIMSPVGTANFRIIFHVFLKDILWFFLRLCRAIVIDMLYPTMVATGAPQKGGKPILSKSNINGRGMFQNGTDRSSIRTRIREKNHQKTHFW